MAQQQGPADLYIVTNGSATLAATFPNMILCVAVMKAAQASALSGTSQGASASVMCVNK
jgi:hypothetical protein